LRRRALEPPQPKALNDKSADIAFDCRKGEVMSQNKQPDKNQLPDQGQNQTQHPDQLGQEKATPQQEPKQEPKTDRERAQHQDKVRVGRENEKS
jgi:hypothetical protein